MNVFIDTAYYSLKKDGEELCGDKVEIERLPHSTIIVLADGLGSGVKANILATLTTKISATMLKEGIDIYETIDTIANTLPLCKVRKIAYSTFTLIKVCDDGKLYMAEYDNPPAFILRNGKKCDIKKEKITINNRNIYESNFYVQPGDSITLVSDGAVHAGLGDIMNLGWTWENILNYLERSTLINSDAQSIVKDLTEICWDLYAGKPGDDTTVVSVRIKEAEYINLFTGPPKDKNNDKRFMKNFINAKGKKVICGGTAANIAERELNKKLNVNLDFKCKEIPPTASMEGIDLITEGVITLSKTVQQLEEYKKRISIPGKYYNIQGEDGASKLARLLLHNCTHLNIWLGKAINPVHQNLDLPVDLSIKFKLVDRIIDLMKKFGKIVNIIDI